ncbi:MAG: hypothetical protein ACF787_08725 [Rhodopirellula sp. JB053]
MSNVLQSHAASFPHAADPSVAQDVVSNDVDVRLSPGEPVGLVAGWGRFPISVANRIREAGNPVVCVARRLLYLI